MSSQHGTIVIPKMGIPRYVWLECPHCSSLYYVDRDFWSPQFDNLQLFCPYCQNYFNKDLCPQLWGI